MTDHRGLIAVVGAMLAGVLVARFLVHPLHARANDLNTEYSSLLERVDGWPGEDAVLSPLRDELHHRLDIVAKEQRPIPEEPDLAGLIRQLSINIDGFNVIDQTFVAGRKGSAATGAPESWRSVPLTMELVSDYQSLQGVMKTIEANADPVRITRVSIERIEQADESHPLIKATLVLDVIHRIQEGKK
jgi:hypothetical protein